MERELVGDAVNDDDMVSDREADGNSKDALKVTDTESEVVGVALIVLLSEFSDVGDSVADNDLLSPSIEALREILVVTERELVGVIVLLSVGERDTLNSTEEDSFERVEESDKLTDDVGDSVTVVVDVLVADSVRLLVCPLMLIEFVKLLDALLHKFDAECVTDDDELPLRVADISLERELLGDCEIVGVADSDFGSGESVSVCDPEAL